LGLFADRGLIPNADRLSKGKESPVDPKGQRREGERRRVSHCRITWEKGEITATAITAK